MKQKEENKKKKESKFSWLDSISEFFSEMADAFTPSHDSHDHDNSSIFDSFDFDSSDD